MYSSDFHIWTEPPIHPERIRYAIEKQSGFDAYPVSDRHEDGVAMISKSWYYFYEDMQAISKLPRFRKVKFILSRQGEDFLDKEVWEFYNGQLKDVTT